ncbi:hypothetical protein KKE26_03265 [bacterium]|nr:hypothetical protein [bacterium]MBU1752721.1 hypothetical protein [bacterium]
MKGKQKLHSRGNPTSSRGRRILPHYHSGYNRLVENSCAHRYDGVLLQTKS